MNGADLTKRTDKLLLFLFYQNRAGSKLLTLRCGKLFIQVEPYWTTPCKIFPFGLTYVAFSYTVFRTRIIKELWFTSSK